MSAAGLHPATARDRVNAPRVVPSLRSKLAAVGPYYATTSSLMFSPKPVIDLVTKMVHVVMSPTPSGAAVPTVESEFVHGP